MAIVRYLEECWASIEDDGPPDMSHVLRHMLPSRSGSSVVSQEEIVQAAGPSGKSGRKNRTARSRDDRTDALVRDQFEGMRVSPGYKKLLASRERLPAFSVKDRLLALLDKNRCVVVIGETGVYATALLT